MFSNAIDADALRGQLARHRRAQVREVLQPDAAERLARCLEDEVPWRVAERAGGTPRHHAPEVLAADSPEYRGLLAAAHAQAGTSFQFVYDSYMLVRAAREGWDRSLVLHVVLEFLNSPQFLAFARYITGDDGIVRADAQATRYRPGQFLLPHSDENRGDDRRYAYVINLSRQWRADWGGLLQFLDARGEVEATFLPLWNSLSLFKVPAEHLVSLVAPWAAQPRLAITGWLMGPPRP
ncbi:2OG-Fe(II) oxygenase [Coralloluteibacterium stylophorae]|uniref:2OG-Fe(II) oxygenase n=1 Tax=Coralloluteibacterium stylophorae TaxID=1776034 RepID=A0A8J8AX87_9GAMM|nr:2OG-Fe(II) oxygenase family protein [Coralloluteibacterium stylophorae]MBS7457146.1 2OG-Fe(II) oxygenase [Coralloluteibacterium stylophorae]